MKVKGHPIGTKVRIVRPGSINYGKVCTVISIPLWGVGQYGKEAGQYQLVDIVIQGGPCGYLVNHLKPVYDGNEKVSWEDCAWRPTNVEAGA